MKRGLVLLVVCLGAASVSAATGRPLDVDARARTAQKIALATVTEVEAGRFDVNEFGDRLIVTRVWLEVEETLKGPYAPVLALDVEGGSIGDLRLEVSDMPVLKRGDRAVFFLDARRDAHVPNGRDHGILRLDATERVVGHGVTLADIRARVRGAQR